MSRSTRQWKSSTTAIDEELGRRIHRRRKSLRLSQQLVGDAIGVSFQQVQKYEQAINRVPASRLPALARILGVEIAWFFWGIEDDE
ncbi:MAG: helix-turn-helix transcriptional regulator [Phycisphaeraceae bacterium]|nr:helix-turn-helix transcriptional regulator [Phycisphaeraceae bacterium]MCB9848161.1 helix-turn-helix transcriptional regulator [Phycisphaeraceae bacterium]